MKLTKMEKSDRRWLKEELAEANGELFHYPEAGIVVAIVPCDVDMGSDSHFVHVAAAYCNFRSGDTYNRKRGEFVALNRWYNNETLPIPREDRENYEIAADFVDFCMA